MRGSNKKSCPGAAALRVGWAAFLHNVIIGHWKTKKTIKTLLMPYNATLCKEALGKKITGMSCEAYVLLHQ